MWSFIAYTTNELIVKWAAEIGSHKAELAAEITRRRSRVAA